MKEPFEITIEIPEGLPEDQQILVAILKLLDELDATSKHRILKCACVLEGIG